MDIVNTDVRHIESNSNFIFEDVVAGLGLIIVVASVSWGVITRYLLETPATWTSEAAAIAFSWVVFVGAAGAFKRHAHIVVDVLLDNLPFPYRHVLQGLSDVVVIATLVVVSMLAIRFCISTYHIPTTILRVPQSLIYAGAAVGFMLMTWRYVQVIYQRLFGENQ